MHFRALLIGVALVGATTAAALQTKGGMPEMGTTHFHRADCHQAYDMLAETLDAGRTISSEDRSWAGTYEANARAKQPCPEPGAALAARVIDRTVSTKQGLGFVALYLEQNDPVAYFEGALAVLQGKAANVQPTEGWQMLVKSANLGYAHAQFFEGALYIAGTATGKADYVTAFPLLEKAAAAGHVDALFMVGNFYYDGTLAPKKDKAKAFSYFSRAAERGHTYATYMAAYMANDGDGVKTDHALAYRLARNLANQGEVVGSVLAASALLQMKDAKDHEDEVLYWFDVAIRDGDAKIKAQIGAMRPRVVAAFQKAKAPPQYTPRVWKSCPMKTTCLVDSVKGIRSCTTNKDYWNDCDG